MIQDSGVLDASGAFKLIATQSLPEAYLHYEFLLSPRIFQFEVGNVCWKYIRFKDLPETIAKEYFSKALESVDLVDSFDYEVIVKIAKQYSLSFYDASYLSLALETQSDLISFDKKLNKAATKAGVSTFF